MKSSIIIRWIARIWSILSIGFILVMFVGAGLSEGVDLARFSTRDVIGLAFFPLGVCVGLVLAWRRERLGGLIAVGSLMAFYLVMYLWDRRFPRGPFFALVAAPGLLFALCSVLGSPRAES